MSDFQDQQSFSTKYDRCIIVKFNTDHNVLAQNAKNVEHVTAFLIDFDGIAVWIRSDQVILF